ncbi:MAG: ABC transporter ATP-binding protein [Rhodobacterales bacterium]|nr:ABC transporter ATP-binding protein [Rhodobacterales bacterium]
MLEVRALNAFYGDSHILHDVALTVGEGEGVAILGRNGAGKSTLLKSIMNAGTRISGEILLDGQSLTGVPFFRRARMGLGIVPEDRRIFPHLTVRENIAMARHAAGPGRPPYTPEEMIDLFGMLKGLEARMGTQLSGGQQQLLAIARTVLSRPRLLLLDEPTEGLAPVIVEQLANDIRQLRAHDRGALLLTEQNVWFSRQCTERCLVIDSGQIVFSGTWEAFDADPSVQNKYLAV